ncbi:MAG: hypothetical protein ACKVQK_01985 [Burkholderiales bacterium]
MYRLLALVTLAIPYAQTLAAEGEVPQETAGMGGVIGFLVVFLVVIGVGFWYVSKTSKMTDEERSGDKIGEDK